MPDTQTISSFKGDLLEIFISLFTNKFLKIFVRNAYRQYVELDEDKQFIKGKIDFSKTILRCGYRKHMHHVRYDDLTMNNLLNAVFKTVILHLVERTASEENRKKLYIALSYLEEINIIRLSKIVFDSIRFNRLNEEYRPLFNLAKMFYYNLTPGYRQGDEEVFTFLVPLNRLFENIVYKLSNELLLEYKNEGYSVQYQGPQEYLAKCEKTEVFKLKPDISIIGDSVDGRKVKSIIDAKYKDPSGISPSDIYQMVSYAVHYNCKSIMLAYPAFKRNRELVNKPLEYIIPTSAGDICLIVIQIDIFEEDINKLKSDFGEMILTNYILKKAVNCECLIR